MQFYNYTNVTASVKQLHVLSLDTARVLWVLVNKTSIYFYSHIVQVYSTYTNQNISVVKVIFPIRSQCPLSSDIPHIKSESLRIDSLDVESTCGLYLIFVLGLSCYHLEDGCLSSIVKTKKKDT